MFDVKSKCFFYPKGFFVMDPVFSCSKLGRCFMMLGFSTEGVLTWLSNKLQASHQCFVKTTNDSFIKHRASPSGFSLIKFYQISISLNSLAVKQYYTRGPPECSKDIAVIRLEVKYEKVLLHPRVLCRVRELMCLCGLGKHCIMDSDRRQLETLCSRLLVRLKGLEFP